MDCCVGAVDDDGLAEAGWLGAAPKVKHPPLLFEVDEDGAEPAPNLKPAPVEAVFVLPAVGSGGLDGALPKANGFDSLELFCSEAGGASCFAAGAPKLKEGVLGFEEAGSAGAVLEEACGAPNVKVEFDG